MRLLLATLAIADALSLVVAASTAHASEAPDQLTVAQAGTTAIDVSRSRSSAGR